MAQQTAVMRLEEKLKTYLSWSSFLEEDFEQAKAMENEKMKEDLIDFQIYLNDEGYIENHDWDFEKEAIVYLHKSK